MDLMEIMDRGNSVSNEPFSNVTDSDVGVLVLHGFTGVPGHVRHLADRLAARGWNVELPLLPGHGTNWRYLNRRKFAEWTAEAEAALSCLAERSSRLFLTGLSMGGALSLYLARRHPEIRGLAVVNHAIYLAGDWRLGLTPLLRYFVPSVHSDPPDVKDPEVKAIGYGRTPVAALHQLMLLLKEVRGGLDRVVQPILILQSREDHVVPPEGAEFTFRKVASTDKELVWLENSYHVATLDHDRDRIAELVVGFIGRILGK